MDAMDGEPVWLCSVSHFGKHGIIGTSDWQPLDYAWANRLAHSALNGIGDARRERAFRMNITFCIHRAISKEEKAKLPGSWDNAVGGLAGGPVEVLWSRGIEHRPASMPCANPEHLAIEPTRSDLWVPNDCGECEPCKARKAIAEKIGFKG